MSDVLSTAQRKSLDTSVQRARVVAEAAADDELRRLAVAEESRPGYLLDDENALRLALREKARQLGDSTGRDADLTLLRADIAYEQWHRLLFARFLEVNRLLREPTGVVVSLEDCAALADHEGEPDGWSVAAKYAAGLLPGVFRLADPSVRVRFSPERRAELEAVVAGIDEGVFRTEDALGWVYQFWQTAQKKRVNESGRKIGGADLSPVTQLFTEDYMVRFLLENSLGAWWAARHPDSPLEATWEYLRTLEDGTPAAGTFDEWPTTAAGVTVMDPCCGSGHFLVAAFGMLWRMRAEEEGLAPADAQDAVLRENLFGLELDPRCAQIAMFNVVLEAWKQGGYRVLPVPQVACSGVPVRGTQSEWEAIAGDQNELRIAMVQLHSLFRNADTLGSIIDPRPVGDGPLIGRDMRLADTWAETERMLTVALGREGRADTVMSVVVSDVAQAARLLGRTYTLIATNPPYLAKSKQSQTLASYLSLRFPASASDLATAFIERCLLMAAESGTAVMVAPQNWLTQGAYEELRRKLLRARSISIVARLGERAFESPAAAGAFVALYIFCNTPVSTIKYADLADLGSAQERARNLRLSSFVAIEHHAASRGPDARITPAGADLPLLANLASASQGIKTGDDPRFRREFWEVRRIGRRWAPLASSVDATVDVGGRSSVVDWNDGTSEMATSAGARIVGKSAWGRRGVLVSQMRDLRVTMYFGELFDTNASPVIPRNPADLPAIWQYLISDQYSRDVRSIESALKVTNSTLVKIGFDRHYWQVVADAAGPLPEPHSDDPTQWLFKGTVPSAAEPLQVAVARLLGYRWPDQEPDDLDALADGDGIVALPALSGELEAASRLRTVLARAYGDTWSSDVERQLVVAAGGKNGVLTDWLRDGFFAHHCKVFGQRPFLWQIWDGRKDGFSAIVNYHRLDNATLAKLTFTTLGGWIDRQRSDAAAGVAGADARLLAAQDLQRRLKLILDGAPPYDVYVRWKEMEEQPIGWQPDLDDGVRLNIRPFVEAGVLRSKVAVHWKKDRGTNPDGSERHNDLHPTLDGRRAARTAVGLGS